MLLKSLCMACHNRYRNRTWEKQPAKERTWGRGKVACVALFDKFKNRHYVQIADKPPGCCYFLLEQTLNQPGS